MRKSCELFCVSEIYASTGEQRRPASHMLPTLCLCQRSLTSSKLDVRSLFQVYEFTSVSFRKFQMHSVRFRSTI